MTPVIIDTDPGIDDAFAIMYALNCGRLDVKGLTTVFGNVTVERATTNALWLLDALGRPDIPVAAGAGTPLSGAEPHLAAEVHGVHGFGDWPAQTATRAAEVAHAADFLIAQSHILGKALNVVAIGPLTNLAHACQIDPGFPSRIGTLSIMGGAFRAPGNVTPSAEANFHNDPDAARIVAECYPEARYFGLDLTDRIPLSQDLIAALVGAKPDWAEFLHRIWTYYAGFYASVGKHAGPSLHDPVPIISLAHPELFQLDAGSVKIDVGMPNRGKSSFHPGAGPARVCFEADIQGILDTFVKGLTTR